MEKELNRVAVILLAAVFMIGAVEAVAKDPVAALENVAFGACVWFMVSSWRRRRGGQ